MDPIYVTGHQNPDTDSIVAAIAYASLRNALGDREYEAACLGRVSDETQIVLNHFGFQPPKMITNVYTQVKDLDYDMPPILSAAVTEDRAWNILREQKGIAAVPVVNEDGTLFGMLSREDVAGYNMELTNACVLDEVPLFNVLSVIEGKVLNDVGEYTDTIAGEVLIIFLEHNLLLASELALVGIIDSSDSLKKCLIERNIGTVVAKKRDCLLLHCVQLVCAVSLADIIKHALNLGKKAAGKVKRHDCVFKGRSIRIGHDGLDLCSLLGDTGFEGRDIICYLDHFKWRDAIGRIPLCEEWICSTTSCHCESNT